MKLLRISLNSNKKEFEFREFLTVGVVHTLLAGAAWGDGRLEMQRDAADHSWVEVERAFKQFTVSSEKPEIVLIPEVSVPRYRLPALQRMSAGLGAVVIAGLDFGTKDRRIVNQAAVLIPSRWPDSQPSLSSRIVLVGKTYPSHEEQSHYDSLQPRLKFYPDPTLWLFDADHLGRFGVCLCFDFMDVDRPPLYRGQIHHLFVLAHNKDVTSFDHIAESLCRTIYCNVIVCNTGSYGGSVAVTPYADHWRRPVYHLQGLDLSSCQVIKVPVNSMERAIRYRNLTKDGKPYLKALPPGFQPRSL